jgi:geranylgeranyl diphosphate synthase, type II
MNTLEYIKSLQARATAELQTRLENSSYSARLGDAMHYAVHNGGKRIRPVLAYASAEAVGGTLTDADNCACAVEMIHAYSLVHDDLPAMDDDELRRGKPTCHIKFDEATAILAGDALQALAFEILAHSELSQDPAISLKMIETLAQASGWNGMVGGQSLDIEGAGKQIKEEDLILMHRLKTGALINASVKLGAISTGLTSSDVLDSLDKFAECIGLAFQIKDDILDVDGLTEVLGKQQGKDQSLNKPTYPSILGMDGARTKMQALFDEGTQALSIFGKDAEKLHGIASYIIERKH